MTTSSSPPPSPPSSGLGQFVLLFLTIVGIPSAVGAIFLDWWKQNPVWAVGIGALYVIVILVAGFVSGVWKQLEKPWTEQTATWVDRNARSIFSGYHKRYCQFLVHEHRFFDVKGLTTQGPHSLKLEQVFVELSLAAKGVQQVSSNPLLVPESLRTGRHTIWDYLDAPQLHDHNLVLIGAPGSGKTTLLCNIALVLAAGRRPRRRLAPAKLPVLLFLRDHIAAISTDPMFSLIQAIRTHLEKRQAPLPPPDWMEQHLVQGDCLVMFDGLDEVGDSAARQQMVAWVERQMQAYGSTRFLISSRPFGYRENPLVGVSVLEVGAFTQLQVERFAHNWYLADTIMSAQIDDEGIRRTARIGANDLLQRVRNTPALADLAVNPLLLTMIAIVHRHRSTLPGRRVELYAEICDVFFGKRQQGRGMTLDLTPAQKQSVLQPLAYHLMLQRQREIRLHEAEAIIQTALAEVSLHVHPATFLKDVENSSGLLLEREHGIYSFAHKTFQEYLTAVYIVEQKYEHVLIERVDQPWWHETILLYAAQSDASIIIKACIHPQRSTIATLSLALEVRDEALKLQPEVRTQLDAVLNQGVEDRDSERRQLVAEALLDRRLRRMARLDERRAMDTSLLSNAEYQLFLDEVAPLGRYYQPDHWTKIRYLGHLPVVGVRPSDAEAFCAWLSKRAGGEWRYRLPKPGEIESYLGNKSTSNRHPRDKGYWVMDQHQVTCTYYSDNTPDWKDSIASRNEADWLLLRKYMEMQVRDFERNFSFDRDIDLATGLNRDLTRAHDLARDLARDLVNASDRARANARANARALDQASDFARDLVNASDSARDHIRDLNRIYTNTIPFTNDLVFTPIVAFARTLAHARTLANTLARANIRERVIDLDRVLIRASDRTSALILNVLPHLVRTLAGEFVREIASTRNLVNSRNLAQDLINVLRLFYSTASPHRQFCILIITVFLKQQPVKLLMQSPRYLNLDATIQLAIKTQILPDLVYTTLNIADQERLDTLTQLFNSALGLETLPAIFADVLIRTTPQPLTTEQVLSRDLARLIALLMLSHIEERLGNRSTSILNRVRTDAEMRQLEEMRQRYQDLYVSLAILAERSAEHIPATEGILLMREVVETDALK